VVTIQIAIDNIVHGIEQAAITAIGLRARVPSQWPKAWRGAFYVVKTSILAVETVIVGIVDAVYEAATQITALEEKSSSRASGCHSGDY